MVILACLPFVRATGVPDTSYEHLYRSVNIWHLLCARCWKKEQ